MKEINFSIAGKQHVIVDPTEKEIAIYQTIESTKRHNCTQEQAELLYESALMRITKYQLAEFDFKIAERGRDSRLEVVKPGVFLVHNLAIMLEAPEESLIVKMGCDFKISYSGKATFVLLRRKKDFSYVADPKWAESSGDDSYASRLLQDSEIPESCKKIDFVSNGNIHATTITNTRGMELMPNMINVNVSASKESDVLPPITVYIEEKRWNEILEKENVKND